MGTLTYAIYLQSRQPTRLTTSFALLISLAAVWILTHGLRLFDIPQPLDAVAVNTDYTARVSLYPMWLVFLLYLTEAPFVLTPRRLLVLFAPAIVMIALIWTDPLHGLAYDAPGTAPLPHALRHLYNSDVNPYTAGLFTIVYVVPLVLFSVHLLAMRTAELRNTYRRQMQLLMAAVGIAAVSQLLVVVAPHSETEFDPTPLLAVFGVGIVAFDVQRYGLFRRVPIYSCRAVSALPHACIVVNQAGDITNANGRALRLMAASAPEFIGWSVARAFAPHPQLAERLVQRTSAGPVRITDGDETRWLQPDFVPIPPTAQHTGGTLITLTDVTSTMARDNPTGSPHLDLLDYVEDIVYKTDAAGHILYLNHAWTRITGFSVDACLGHDLRDYVLPTDDFFEIEHADGADSELRATVTIRSQTGHVVYGQLHQADGRAVDGTLYRRGTITDISAQVLAEKALGQHAAILNAVRSAARHFLGAGDWDDHIADVLDMIGKASRAGVVRLYQQDTLESEFLSQASWVVTCWQDNSVMQGCSRDLMNTVSSGQARETWLIPTLNRATEVHWHVSDRHVAPGAAELSRVVGVSNTVLLPIRVSGHAWGVLEFSHTDPDARFTTAERRALTAAADVIMTALERRLDAQIIQQQTDILDAVARAATDFLLADDWRARLPSFLQQMAVATDVSRVYIYERDAVQRDYVRCIAEYAMPPAQPQPTTEGIGFPMEAAFPRFTSMFRQGLAIKSVVHDLADDERRFFETHGVKSLLCIPIMVDGDWWGTITFDDMNAPRKWSYGHERALRTAAQMLSSTIRFDRAKRKTQHYTQALEERNQELDTFSRLIAHDLKAPLSTLISMARLTVDEHQANIPEMVLDHLVRIGELGQDMNSMIEQLLWLARLRNTVTMGLVETDFALDVALARFREAIQARGIRITRSRLPVTRGQQAWVTEVLANLVSNAVKYIGDDNTAPAIDICVERAAGEVRIMVVDNGIGIPSSHHSNIFEAFKYSAAGYVRGHGLGLTLVSHMVKKMHGRVGFESRVGEGSTFWFTLPVIDEAELASLAL